MVEQLDHRFALATHHAEALVGGGVATVLAHRSHHRRGTAPLRRERAGHLDEVVAGHKTRQHAEHSLHAWGLRGVDDQPEERVVARGEVVGISGGRELAMDRTELVDEGIAVLLRGTPHREAEGETVELVLIAHRLLGDRVHERAAVRFDADEPFAFK